jgi:hypothetical protein
VSVSLLHFSEGAEVTNDHSGIHHEEIELKKEKQNMKQDTTRSDAIVKGFKDSEVKFKRHASQFSGTWETTLDELFPLFCPAREADWIPGWDCQLIYTESGYAEDKVIFKTDNSNPVGEGVWAFTGFKTNEYIQFVRFQEDIILHAKITLVDNKDGTVTATWDVVSTALTEDGNKEIERMSAAGASHHHPIVLLIESYLKQ